MRIRELPSRLAVVAALGAVVTGATATTAQAAPTYWKFKNHATGKCLTAGTGTKAYMANCSGSTYQQWDWVGSTFYKQVKSRATGRCLVTDYKTNVNAVWTGTCKSVRGQRWRYFGNTNMFYNEGNGSNFALRTTTGSASAVYACYYTGCDGWGTYLEWTGTHN
jgi:hypothetical protein